jgi:hypothetical protein
MKTFKLTLLLFIAIISGCSEHNKTPEAGELNAKASLPPDLNFNKMGLKVIASTVNKKLGTMATLYGNDFAKATANAGNGKCLPMSVFTLVTWKQQPDKRWLGGNIPGKLLLVEVLKSTMEGQRGDLAYTRFQGVSLQPDPDTSGQQARKKYILALKPSIMF